MNQTHGLILDDSRECAPVCTLKVNHRILGNRKVSLQVLKNKNTASTPVFGSLTLLGALVFWYYRQFQDSPDVFNWYGLLQTYPPQNGGGQRALSNIQSSPFLCLSTIQSLSSGGSSVLLVWVLL